MPDAHDSFLDIGCGLGLNLIPISARVSRAAGCDHPNVINRLKQQSPDLNADLIGGDFLKLNSRNHILKFLPIAFCRLYQISTRLRLLLIKRSRF